MTPDKDRESEQPRPVEASRDNTDSRFKRHTNLLERVFNGFNDFIGLLVDYYSEKLSSISFGYQGFKILFSVLLPNKKTAAIHRPPGSSLQGILRFLYSKRSFDNIFSQIINDMREEYYEALSKNHVWHARWIRIRGLTATLTTMLFHAFTSCGKVVAKIWKMTP